MGKFEQEIGLCVTQGVPLAYTQTADIPNTEKWIVAAIVQNARDRGADVPPIYRIDGARGLQMLNESSKRFAPILLGKTPPAMFADAFKAAKSILPGIDEDGTAYGLPADAIVLWWEADRAWAREGVPVALLGARDPIANGPRGLVMGLGASAALPSLIAGDVIILHAPLPDERERTSRIRSLAEGNGMAMDAAEVARAQGLGCGLTPFQLEGSAAMACGGDTFDMDVMALRAREMLAGLPGVKVDVPEPPEFVGGLPWATQFARELCEDIPFRLIVLLDEADLMMPRRGGGGSDGGSAAGMYQEVLTHMVDRRECTTVGLNATGIPGTGKSTFARMLAAMARSLIITLDVGAMANMYVGESKQNSIRTFAAIRSFGGVHCWVATSNRTHADDGSPLFNEEWLSRCTLGFLFHDAPDLTALDSIWDAQCRKGKRDPSEKYVRAGWTGRDVASVIELANLRNCPIERVAKDHIPALRTVQAEVAERRRVAAANGYRDAATGLPYVMPVAGLVSAPVEGTRKLRGKGNAGVVPAAPTNEGTF